MIEMKLRSILKQVKSEDPNKRFEAMDLLYQYKLDEGLEVQVDVLKDIIKIATTKFPEPVDKWDNPSYYLIDFVCDFPMEEVVEGVLKHFEGLDLLAKERAIEFLLSTEDEGIFYRLEEKITTLIQSEDASLPIQELSSFPAFVIAILDQTIDKIHSPHYKFMMYELILAIHSSGLEQSYKKDFILPILLEDYQKSMAEYLRYDSEYRTKYVYTSWKDSYFIIRSQMMLLLNLMEFYFTPETEKELINALHFHDPLIKTQVLLVCVDKNLPYDKNLLKNCAENIESAEMVYWELKDKNKEHLYPFSTGKQKLLAKTRLFSTITNLPEEEGVIHFPEEIKVVDQLETENAYGQPIRYYMMSFQGAGHTNIGWAGGYALEDGDDTPHLWDGTYTEFIEMDSLSIEEHKQAFYRKREEDQHEYENTIYYESQPKVSKGMWFFYALLMSHWIKAFIAGIQDNFVSPIVFTLVGAVLTVYETNKNKRRKVAIVGRKLIVKEGKKIESIDLAQIKKVEYNKKHVLVYNKNNNVEVKFPLKWVRYEQFYVYMKEHTHHLKNMPYIQD